MDTNQTAETAPSADPASETTPCESEPKRRPRQSGLRSLKRAFSAGRLWYYSTKAYRAGLYPVAWLLKAASFFLFRSVLCVQCEVEPDIDLKHFGLGCSVSPNVSIGRRVKIHHFAAIAGETAIKSQSRIIIEDDVVIGTHAIIIGNDYGGLRIGKGAIIGAGAVVNRDVPPGVVVLPIPARAVKKVKNGEEF